MSRKKGSKNKPKEVVKEIKVEPTVIEPPKEPVKEGRVKQVGNPVALAEPWKPEPEINVEAPKESKKACRCGDNKDSHYGGERGWCNRPGCECQEFK